MMEGLRSSFPYQVCLLPQQKNKAISLKWIHFLPLSHISLLPEFRQESWTGEAAAYMNPGSNKGNQIVFEILRESLLIAIEIVKRSGVAL